MELDKEALEAAFVKVWDTQNYDKCAYANTNIVWRNDKSIAELEASEWWHEEETVKHLRDICATAITAYLAARPTKDMLNVTVDGLPLNILNPGDFKEIRIKAARPTNSTVQDIDLDKDCQLSSNRAIAMSLNEQQQAARPGVVDTMILKGTAKYSGDGWKDSVKQGDVAFVWNQEKPEPYAKGQFPRVNNEIYAASSEQFDFVPATIDEVAPLINAAFNELRRNKEALSAITQPTMVDDSEEQTLADWRLTKLRRCSPNVTPQEYLKALSDDNYIHPDSEAAITQTEVKDAHVCGGRTDGYGGFTCVGCGEYNPRETAVKGGDA